MPRKEKVVQSESHREENEDSVVVVTNTAGQPHAVVVKTVAATSTEFTVLGVVWYHNLKQKRALLLLLCYTNHAEIRASLMGH